MGDLAKPGVGLDLRRTRHRLDKFLLRQCGSRHWARLEQLRFDDAVGQATFDRYLLAVQQLEERQQQLDRQLGEVLVPWHWAPGGGSRCRE